MFSVLSSSIMCYICELLMLLCFSFTLGVLTKKQYRLHGYPRAPSGLHLCSDMSSRFWFTAWAIRIKVVMSQN